MNDGRSIWPLSQVEVEDLDVLSSVMFFANRVGIRCYGRREEMT